MTESKRGLSRREISDLVESVYITTMEDDDFVLVSVQDPDKERTEADPGVGLYVVNAHKETWGEFIPCWLVAEDNLGNWTVVAHEGRVLQFHGGSKIESVVHTPNSSV